MGVLLQRNVDVSVKDRLGRSALFFAAGNGDMETTAMLIQSSARTNDGSLHEAARELHPGIISHLIGAGHDVNFTSTKHEGLTPLGELAMYCDTRMAKNKVEQCVESLVRAKADPFKQWRGKTVLYMAFHNPNPLLVTSILLERFMYKYVNHEANIYNEDDLFYSPTMYLQKEHVWVSEDLRRSLIRLLKSHGAEDRYYASEGLRQPHDAVGMPFHILNSERRRREHEEDMQRGLEEHEASLRRQLEQAQQRFDLQEVHQQQHLRHRSEEAQQHYYLQEIEQEQYLRHQEERFELQHYHTISMADTQAQIQYQQDYQSIQARLQELEVERESEQLEIEQDEERLELQWQANEIQAEADYDYIVAQQQLKYLDSWAERETAANNYQIKRQNVMARSLVAMIKNRSSPEALAAIQQATLAELMEQYPESQLLIEC